MKNLKLFVVDDDTYYLNLFEQHLLNLGISNVKLFNNGTDCLNHLSQNPDVIFLDYNMDHLTGFEVLKKIKRYNPNLHVVMISAQSEIMPAVDSLKHGAFDYLQKGENEFEKIKSTLQNIHEVQILIENRKPTLLQKLLSFK